MPELPEVETTRRGIEPQLVGVRVTEVIVSRGEVDRPAEIAHRSMHVSLLHEIFSDEEPHTPLLPEQASWHIHGASTRPLYDTPRPTARPCPADLPHRTATRGQFLV
ncbi:MAG: DNA-formamidopyrimidine glycosylase family protein [Verrucomicrobiota bacterium]